MKETGINPTGNRQGRRTPDALPLPTKEKEKGSFTLNSRATRESRLNLRQRRGEGKKKILEQRGPPQSGLPGIVSTKKKKNGRKFDIPGGRRRVASSVPESRKGKSGVRVNSDWKRKEAKVMVW